MIKERGLQSGCSRPINRTRTDSIKGLTQWTVALLLIVSIAGCAAVPAVPETLGDNGLLVAEFAGGRRGASDTVRARIGGKTHTTRLQDGRFLLLPLPPGDYVLESLVHGDLSLSTTYTLNQKLRIERGTVTSLGMFVGVTRDVNSLGQRTTWSLEVFSVDDAAVIAGYLKTRHPRLYASLADSAVRMAPRRYLRLNELEPLRHEMAKQGMISMAVLHRYWQDTRLVVAGDVGTVGRLERAGSGRVTKVTIYDTGSLDSVNPYLCDADNVRLACVVGERLFIHDGRSATYRELPLKAPQRAGRLHLTKSAGMVLTDNKFNVYTSRDHGRTWRTYTGATIDAGLSNPNAVHLAPGKDGYYLYSSYEDRTVLFARYADDKFERVAIPDSFKQVNVLRESPAGVMVIPAYTGKDKSHLYIGQWGSRKWDIREIPGRMCSNMWVKDVSANQLRAYCLFDAYDSDDGGKTWRTAPNL